MWPFKSKYEKITTEQVDDAIFKINSQIKRNDLELLQLNKEIENTTQLAREEKSREVKLTYVKKVSYYKKKKVNIAKRNDYLLYNTFLLDKLKTSIEDNNMYQTMNGISLNKLVSDHVGLRKFLLKSLNIKQTSEENLVSSNEAFEDIDSLYSGADEIYGKSASDDELLAEFEKEDAMLDEMNSDEKLLELNKKENGEK